MAENWSYLEKPKTVLASASLIKEFVEMEPAPYDRPLSERRMQVYERILAAGEFRTVIWASALCEETGTTYRVNGKHTSLLLSGKHPIPELHVTVERYQCNTLLDVGRLYNTFDSQIGARTTRDINRAFAATIPELREVNDRFIQLAVTAAAFHRFTEAELAKTSPAERAELLLDEIEFIKWLENQVSPHANSRTKANVQLLRSPVIAAMMITHRKSPRVATEFWNLVQTEAAADRDDTTRVLARFLIKATLGGTRHMRRAATKSDLDIVSARELYAKCIHAWNAWRRGDQIGTLKYQSGKPLPEPTK